MRVYSNYDILGKMLGTREDNKNFLLRLRDWIESYSNTVVVAFEIPAIILLKTEDICETINEKYKEYHVDFYIPTLVGVIYNHYIDKAYTSKNGLKQIYDLLVQHVETSPVTVFHNAKKVYEEYRTKKIKKYEIEMKMSKRELRRGELLLYELDELYGRRFTVESFIEVVWTDFINERRFKRTGKIIEEILEILDN